MIYDNSKKVRSPGNSFAYEVQGPVCRLFDREELPWPSCSLVWKGKQPSWRRYGPRLVADLTARRFPSYAVYASDATGLVWEQVITFYDQRLTTEELKWWYSPRNERNDYPDHVEK